MVLTLIFGLLKKQIHYSVRLFVGVFSIFSGLGISYLLFTLGNVNYSTIVEIGFQIIPLWIILYGVYELLKAIQTTRIKNINVTSE